MAPEFTRIYLFIEFINMSFILGSLLGSTGIRMMFEEGLSSLMSSTFSLSEVTSCLIYASGFVLSTESV